MNTLVDSILFYMHQHPQAWLALWGILVTLLVIRSLPKYHPADQVSREFRKAGIYPSEQQAQALRDDFVRIAAEGARKGLEEHLKHQAAIQRDKQQVARVAEISVAHVAVIREVGATLQALELEYMKYRKSLASEQAKEALRVIVEKAVTQITEMADASTTTLPQFVITDLKVDDLKIDQVKMDHVSSNGVKLNGLYEPVRNGEGVRH